MVTLTSMQVSLYFADIMFGTWTYLSSTKHPRTDFSSDDIVKRNLGMALIAGQYIVRVCVQEGDEVV